MLGLENEPQRRKSPRKSAGEAGKTTTRKQLIVPTKLFASAMSAVRTSGSRSGTAATNASSSSPRMTKQQTSSITASVHPSSSPQQPGGVTSRRPSKLQPLLPTASLSASKKNLSKGDPQQHMRGDIDDSSSSSISTYEHNSGVASPLFTAGGSGFLIREESPSPEEFDPAIVERIMRKKLEERKTLKSTTTSYATSSSTAAQNLGEGHYSQLGPSATSTGRSSEDPPKKMSKNHPPASSSCSSRPAIGMMEKQLDEQPKQKVTKAGPPPARPKTPTGITAVSDHIRFINQIQKTKTTAENEMKAAPPPPYLITGAQNKSPSKLIEHTRAKQLPGIGRAPSNGGIFMKSTSPTSRKEHEDMRNGITTTGGTTVNSAEHQISSHPKAASSATRSFTPGIITGSFTTTSTSREMTIFSEGPPSEMVVVSPPFFLPNPHRVTTNYSAKPPVSKPLPPPPPLSVQHQSEMPMPRPPKPKGYDWDAVDDIGSCSRGKQTDFVPTTFTSDDIIDLDFDEVSDEVDAFPMTMFSQVRGGTASQLAPSAAAACTKPTTTASKIVGANNPSSSSSRNGFEPSENTKKAETSISSPQSLLAKASNLSDLLIQNLQSETRGLQAHQRIGGQAQIGNTSSSTMGPAPTSTKTAFLGAGSGGFPSTTSSSPSSSNFATTTSTTRVGASATASMTRVAAGAVVKAPYDSLPKGLADLDGLSATKRHKQQPRKPILLLHKENIDQNILGGGGAATRGNAKMDVEVIDISSPVSSRDKAGPGGKHAQGGKK
ncbi:unnamed protein product [Amoebophrya sp. A25]|nr:unnamed protein product [Amoebophrya sp. A25]|eukprot:GSA25T00020582001.1